MLFAEFDDFPSVSNVLSAVAIFSIVALLSSSAARIAFVEAAVNITCQLSEVPRLAHGSKKIPGVPFQWPNGQGTIKFFDGRNASREWRKQFGSLYRIWSGFNREIVLTKPTQVKAFYHDSHVHIKSSDNNAGWLFGELLGECVGVVSQKRWQRVRGHFDGHFTRSVSLDRTGIFAADARDFLRSLDCVEGDFIIDPAHELKYCPFFMVASIFFGHLTPEQRTKLCVIGPRREELFRETFMGGINRFIIAKYIPGSALSRLQSFQSEWEEFVIAASKDAQVRGSGAIVSLWKAVQNKELSMRELLHTLDESLFANLDVTTHALAWNIIRLSQYTDIQKQICFEMQECAGEPEHYDKYLRKEDTLLAACVVEASRLHPVLPFSNPESAEDDKLIDGCTILRKTDVIVDAYAINVDNPYWKNAQDYDPYRHLGKRDPARRYNMWRFGFGPRQCLGKHVADIILRIILAELLKRYRLELVEDERTDTMKLQADSWIGLPSVRVRLVPQIN